MTHTDPRPRRTRRGRSRIALAAAGHFGVQPILAQLKADALPRQVMESALRDRFATWHGVSSALYLVQTLLGIALEFMVAYLVQKSSVAAFVNGEDLATMRAFDLVHSVPFRVTMRAAALFELSCEA